MHFKSVAAVAGLVGLTQAKASNPVGRRAPGYDAPPYSAPAPDYGPVAPSCPADGYTQVMVSTNVISYPVVINQYYEQNTVIIINGGVTININNAPTTLSTTVTATSTETVTSTVGPAVQTPILIQIQGALARRQAGALYLGEGGAVVGSCGQAAQFTTDASGQLFSNGEQVSTTTGATEQLVAVSATVGDITSAFSANGGFSWTNSAFFDNEATFCTKGNLLYAEFTETIPEGCSKQVLSAVPASGCGASPSTTPLSTTFNTLIIPTTTASSNGTTSV